MADDTRAGESAAALDTLPPELQEIENRFLQDSLVWGADLDGVARLTQLVQSLPGGKSTDMAVLLKTLDEEPDADGIESVEATPLAKHHPMMQSPGKQKSPSPWIAGVVTLVIVALLAIVFSTLSPGHISRTGTTATTTATATVPLSGPTPSPMPGKSGPVIPGGPNPFTITAIRADAQTYASPQPDAICLGPSSNTNPDTFQIASVWAFFYYVPDTNGGDIVYRWHLSDGQVIGPLTISARYPSYNMQLNSLGEPTDFHIPSTEANGAQMWAQLEMTAPSHMVAPRVSFYAPRCVFTMRSVQTFAGNNVSHSYQCGGSDPQTWTFTGNIILTLSYGGTVTYYWQQPDGTASQTFSANVAPGVDQVAAQPYVLTLTSSSPNASYQPKLIVTSPSQSPGGYILYDSISKSC